jgi:hypothetical protein
MASVTVYCRCASRLRCLQRTESPNPAIAVPKSKTVTGSGTTLSSMIWVDQMSVPDAHSKRVEKDRNSRKKRELQWSGKTLSQCR